jgi:hypothetical protein
VDEYIKSVYLEMRKQHGASVDDVLEEPQLRSAFLHCARQYLPEMSERDLLHRLVYLRKKGRLLPAKNSSGV